MYKKKSCATKPMHMQFQVEVAGWQVIRELPLTSQCS